VRRTRIRVRDMAPSAWETAAAVLVAVFLAAQIVLILRLANGPTLDEAIYLTAGRRTLEGHGYADGYMGWFAGSLLWPALAGIGDAVGGLAGARILAAVFVSVAVIAIWRATVILFGDRAAFLTVILAVATGPIVALGHLAVIDAPAVAGIAVAFWATAELARRDHRGWLVVAAGALCFAVLSKYPAAVSALPLVALIVLMRRQAAPMDLAMAGLLAGAVLLVYFLSARGPLSDFVSWRVENNPGFGVTRPMVAFSQLWYGGVPLLLALGGWFVCRRKWLATVLLMGGLIFPLYHVAIGNSVGDTKHIVFGLVFLLPLAGRLLDRIAAESGVVLACLVAVAAGAFGTFQADRLDRAWVDVRPAADYLAAHAQPGQRFLINNSWPFTQRLYETGKIESPWQVFDVYRVRHGELHTSVCKADWFVVAQGAGRWPTEVRQRIAACGNFRRVYRKRAPVTNLGRDLSWVTWTGRVAIYRNVRTGKTG
jgi:4-amino-4-deoxy-L-arabinose transferase-like glycosyltransferase